jgi:3-oxoacyl-[acyl-carrier-protein] synthase II
MSPNAADLAANGWFKPDPARMGCNIGAGLICTDLDELTEAMAESRNPDNTMNLTAWGRSEDPTKTSGMEKLTPLWLLKYLPNMLSCHVSIIHDTQGPSNTITCGQASAGLAIMEAARTIQRGQADLAIAGGAESKVHAMALMRWSLVGRLNGTSNANPGAACRPYDQQAAGAVIAEGGAVFVVEEYEHAKKRGATIYAEVAGLGSTGSAGASPIEPEPSGEAAAYAMKRALREAGVEPSHVQLIVPPGFGVAEWDRADVAAFRRTFATLPTMLPARAGIGDCGAGAQAMDIAAGVMAIRDQVIPPAANVEHPLEGVRVLRQKTPAAIDNVLVLSCALGGQNSAVVLKKIA